MRYFNLWLSIGWFMVLAVCYLTLMPDPPDLDIDFDYIDKVEHFLAYLILMGWFSQLYKTFKIKLFYVLFLVLMGVTLEILQGLGTSRFFEYSDMLANTLGVVFAWIVTKKRFNNLLLSFERILFN